MATGVKGSILVPVAQLERPVDLAVGWLGVSKLLSSPRGKNVAVRGTPLECDTIVVSLAEKIQVLCMEMTQTPVPDLGIGDCVHC